MKPCPEGRAPGRKCAVTNSRRVTGRRPGSAGTARDGPAMNASGRTVNSSSATSLSNPAGSATGFRPPVSAAASAGVCVPTPWLRASWLPKQDSQGIARPPAVNSRMAASSRPG